jgi:hypothetical protein
VTGVTLAWLTAIGLETWRWESGQGNPTLPPPSIYVKAALAFTILGLAAQVAPKPAQLFAWGMVIAAGVNQNLFAPVKAPAAAKGSKTPPAGGTSVAGTSSTMGKTVAP